MPSGRMGAVGAKPTVTAFDPGDVAGGVVWLDASDASTLALSGNDVTQWDDKFNSYAFTQGSGSAQPSNNVITQNGLVTVDFDGGDYVTWDAGSDVIDISAFTLFAVIRVDVGAPNFCRLVTGRPSASGSANRQLLIRASSDVVYSQVGIATVTVAYTSSVFFLAEVNYNGTTLSISVNNGTPGTNTTSASPSLRYLRLGGECGSTGNPPSFSNGFPGAIGEFILYDSSLSAGDRSSVRTYLNDKWAIY